MDAAGTTVWAKLTLIRLARQPWQPCDALPQYTMVKVLATGRLNFGPERVFSSSTTSPPAWVHSLAVMLQTDDGMVEQLTKQGNQIADRLEMAANGRQSIPAYSAGRIRFWKGSGYVMQCCGTILCRVASTGVRQPGSERARAKRKGGVRAGC